MGKLEEALKKANVEDIHLGPTSEKDEKDKTDVLAQGSAQKKREEEDREQQPPTHTEPVSTSPLEIERPVDFRVVVYHRPSSLPAEHFKILRAKIMHPQNGKKIKSVLITSALENEGKTMVSCNLAVSIAQSIDPWVLLIDGDVRQASIHKTLGLRKRPGLTDYLITGKPLANFLMKGIMDKMTVLQAGSAVRNPAELMTSEKMQMLLEEVKERYDDRFVIVDSPPVNLAAETLVLAEQVDAVILVVRYGVSLKNAVDEAIDRLGKEKILGFVFNSFEITPKKFTYYNYKYYNVAY